MVVLNVRSNPSTASPLLGAQSIGALGVITGGPVFADGRWWRQVDYDRSPDGWSVEDFLVKYTVGLPAPSFSLPSAKIIFTLPLRLGSRGQEVAQLQKFLARDPQLYPERLVTGYFGLLTEKALERFQCKYGIVCSGSSQTTGYGAVGPRTRAKLNQAQ